MQAYTPAQVERILRNFLDIRATLEARGQQLPDLYITGPKREGTRHARMTTDGKAKARLMEELHVATIDILDGLHRVSHDDAYLLINYYILGNSTLDDFVRERKMHSRGSMQRRIARAVQRLTRVLEDEHKTT